MIQREKEVVAYFKAVSRVWAPKSAIMVAGNPTEIRIGTDTEIA
jgi:hypothetical protein